jgi:hypothetical protein
MSGHLLIARLDGLEHALGTVTFAAGDASVYLRPISTPTAVYDYGRGEIPAGATEMTFVTSGQLQAAERPHISIHESGKCHVRSGQGTAVGADATDIGPLSGFTGAHVGPILVGDVQTLPSLADVWPDVGARDEDAEPWDATAPGQQGSLRVSVYVSRNSQKPRPLSHRHHEEWRRRSDGGRLSVVMEAFADRPLPGSVPMVGAIGGWDPRAALDPNRRAAFVFVRDKRGPV